MSSTKAKSKTAAAAEVSEATAPIARCPKTGRPLDQWGLPVNGPARTAALEELGMPDPNEDPAAWAKQLPVDTAVLASTLPPEPVDVTDSATLPSADDQLGNKE
jgi:hypothetical protein